MGNYVSSALSKTSSSSSPAARVILPNGEVRRIHEPTKAAELMMEIPSFFLVDAKSLKIGRKFNPLAADDDLQIKSCHVYIAFPMTLPADVISFSSRDGFSSGNHDSLVSKLELLNCETEGNVTRQSSQFHKLTSMASSQKISLSPVKRNRKIKGKPKKKGKASSKFDSAGPKQASITKFFNKVPSDDTKA
ncbi:unnamed protein product [Brassica oleracea]